MEASTATKNIGRIEQIQGVVVEAVFPDKLPEINHAVEVQHRQVVGVLAPGLADEAVVLLGALVVSGSGGAQELWLAHSSRGYPSRTDRLRRPRERAAEPVSSTTVLA